MVISKVLQKHLPIFNKLRQYDKRQRILKMQEESLSSLSSLKSLKISKESQKVVKQFHLEDVFKKRRQRAEWELKSNMKKNKRPKVNLGKLLNHKFKNQFLRT